MKTPSYHQAEALTRYLNRPPEVAQLSMFEQIELAYSQAPDLERYETQGALISAEKNRHEWARRYLADGPMVTLKQGRASYKLRNNVGRLEALAAIVAKSPCWNGKKPPKNRSAPANGALYVHPLGFKLWIPITMSKDAFAQIGAVKLTLKHRKRHAWDDSKLLGGDLEGTIPASWLIDLNADSACIHEVMP